MFRAVVLALALFLAPVTANAGPTELAIGDSIAVGLRLPSFAQVGIGPHAVFARIASLPPEALRGRVVVLSTGMSNNPADWKYVPWQLTALDAAGARVVVLGVGNEIDQATKINEWLGKLAKAHKMIFIHGWQAVHPESYAELLRYIHAAECNAWRICGI